MEECQCQICGAAALQTWANVRLCQAHYAEVKRETSHYYQKRIAYSARPTYMQIAHLIPWSRKGRVE